MGKNNELRYLDKRNIDSDMTPKYIIKDFPELLIKEVNNNLYRDE